jgi:phage tail sheath protein FI
MAEYLSPEVYIEEIPSGIKPIQGVGTSTAAFVGIAQKGPFGEAIPITNFAQFVKTFGTFIGNGYLAYAVRSFFAEGGTSCYVVRTCHYEVPNASPPGTLPAPAAVAANRALQNTVGPIDVLRLTALWRGAYGNDISVRVVHSAGAQFLIELRDKGTLVETYADLTMDPALPAPGNPDNYAPRRINASSAYVTAEDMVPGGSALTMAQRRPAPTTNPVFLQSGNDGLTDSGGVSTLKPSDFAGVPGVGNGLLAFDKVDSINLVAVPDATERAVHLKGYAYCELRKDCFYIADSQSTFATADDLVNYKLAQGVYSGQNSFNSKYGALYAPWVVVFDPRTGKSLQVPPSGAVAGRYAGVDTARGVHKAAAGVEDGRMLSVLDVAVELSDADQAKLNPLGINVIRKLPGVGTTIWGARTVSTDPEWTYLNVRRFFLFVEESIEKATKWTVFEPNTPALWKAITLNVSAFLRTQWSIGALLGLKEEHAFYVKCDAETNPPESVDLGRVITEVGLAVVKPAEFVVLRFSQFSPIP